MKELIELCKKNSLWNEGCECLENCDGLWRENRMMWQIQRRMILIDLGRVVLIWMNQTGFKHMEKGICHKCSRWTFIDSIQMKNATNTNLHTQCVKQNKIYSVPLTNGSFCECFSKRIHFLKNDQMIIKQGNHEMKEMIMLVTWWTIHISMRMKTGVDCSEKQFLHLNWFVFCFCVLNHSVQNVKMDVLVNQTKCIWREMVHSFMKKTIVFVCHSISFLMMEMKWYSCVEHWIWMFNEVMNGFVVKMDLFSTNESMFWIWMNTIPLIVLVFNLKDEQQNNVMKGFML